MAEIFYSELDFADLASVRVVARIHQSAPLNWDANYVLNEDSVDFMAQLFLDSAGDASRLFLIARNDAADIVGFHWLQIEEKNNNPGGHICSLWVADACRGRGIGRELKLRGEAWAKSRGATLVYTDVFYANQKMIDYNLKLGFQAMQVEMIKHI